MVEQNIQELIEEGILDFTLGDDESALHKLQLAVEIEPESFDAWLALTEIYLSLNRLDEALKAGQSTHKLNPLDVHINTSLSRIWVQKEDKQKAEHFAAQARLAGWRKELNNPTS